MPSAGNHDLQQQPQCNVGALAAAVEQRGHPNGRDEEQEIARRQSYGVSQLFFIDEASLTSGVLRTLTVSYHILTLVPHHRSLEMHEAFITFKEAHHGGDRRRRAQPCALLARQMFLQLSVAENATMQVCCARRACTKTLAGHVRSAFWARLGQCRAPGLWNSGPMIRRRVQPQHREHFAFIMSWECL